MCAGLQLHYAVEPEPLDTAGAVRFAAHDAGIDERFVVVNGDVLTDLDVTRAGRVPRQPTTPRRRSRCTGWTTRRPSGWCPPTRTDGCRRSSRSRRRARRPTDLINAGTYVLEPSVLDRIPAGRKVSIERETFPAIVADGRLFALRRRHLLDRHRHARRRTCEAQLDLVDGVRGVRWPAVSADATVDATASVEHSIVGAGASIAKGADGARLGRAPGRCRRRRARWSRARSSGPGPPSAPRPASPASASSASAPRSPPARRSTASGR